MLPTSPAPASFARPKRVEQVEPENRSSMLRASILESALELGVGSSRTVANWIFNPVAEADEEEAAAVATDPWREFRSARGARGGALPDIDGQDEMGREGREGRQKVVAEVVVVGQAASPSQSSRSCSTSSATATASWLIHPAGSFSLAHTLSFTRLICGIRTVTMNDNFSTRALGSRSPLLSVRLLPPRPKFA